ncbi:MAG TPA: hypoxanthine-guanine phosphoribosyltransferase [Rhodocyclaceae bacterium]|nr:hypoxanthine-guanine phosphoribosyltransferase [Rhodocyclaceae bacterium]
MTPDEARQILADADLICSEAEVAAALNRLGAEITARLEDANPLVLTVMGGAVVFAGQLLPRMRFPLECDYLHATRYGDVTTGGELAWVVEPRTPVSGRVVLVLDDILDEGITLATIKSRLLAQGARECLVAVLTEKELGCEKPIRPDFVGLRLPNRYVFGCGMDIMGAWRNLPAIYAMRSVPGQ